MNDPRKIISQYLDGNLPPQQFRALCQWLTASDSNARLFLDEVSLHRNIREWYIGEDMHSYHLTAATDHATDEEDAPQEDLLTLIKALTPKEPLRMEDLRVMTEADMAAHQPARRQHPEHQPDQATDHAAAPAGRKNNNLVFNFAGIRLYTGVEREEMAYGFRMRYLAYAALFLAVIIFAAMQLWPKTEQTTPVAGETSPQVVEDAPVPGHRVVATLGRTLDAQWDITTTPQAGIELHEARTFTLTEGIVELLMQRGARVVIESPARVELLTDNRLRLDRGKLVAHVPQRAKLFQVDTPTATVIDLGTEFGVQVDQDGEVQTVVYDGRIKLTNRPTQESPAEVSLTLDAGQAATVSRQAIIQPQPVEAIATRFVRQVPDTAHARIALALDPVLYWSFDDIEDDIIRNHVGDRYHGELHGSFSTATGPGQQALFFPPAPTGTSANHIRLEQPIRELAWTRQFTVAMWVRVEDYHRAMLMDMYVPGMGRTGTHVLMIELIDEPFVTEQGYPPRRVRVVHRDPPSGNPRVGSIILSDREYPVGQWMHLAVVKHDDRMQLYMDGELAGEVDNDALVTGLPQFITGALTADVFGNQSIRENIRRLKGNMDELIILNRAISAAELKTLTSLKPKDRENPANDEDHGPVQDM